MTRSRSPKPGLSVTYHRSRGRVVGIAVDGHAGFDVHGRDIVCAAVSALVLAGAHGVARHCGARVHVIDDGAGAYRLSVPGGGDARAQAVLETIVSGLRAIARSYPGTLRIRTVAGKNPRASKQRRPARSAKD